jgi:hypothetical protein
MKVKTVPSTWIRKGGRRFDCGPYLSGGLEAKLVLEELSTSKDTLSSVTTGLVNPGRIKRTWVFDPAHGTPFLTSTDILKADLTRLRLIANTAVEENPRLCIQPEWTLITRAGTIGRMAWARPDLRDVACTEDVLRVIPDKQRIRSGYLYAFLASKFGVPMVISGTYGAIIQHIEPHHIENLPVPRFSPRLEDQVHDLMAESSSNLTRFQSLLNAATSQFLQGVGLSEVSPKEWHSQGPDTGFSESSPNRRSLRALNYNPRFKALCEQIQSGPWKPLGEICLPGTLKRGGRFKRVDADPEHAYQLVGQKQLFWLHPEGRWIAKWALDDDVIVEPGTILVAAQGTLGETELFSRAEFAWGPGVELAYSEHILRVVADEQIMPRGALFAFMRSETAFRMLRSISVGTKLQGHHYAFRPSLPVPYPDRAIQEDVHEMVVDAYNSRHRGVALELEAIRLVEKAIEEAE